VPTRPDIIPAEDDSRSDPVRAARTAGGEHDASERIPDATALRVADTMFALSTPSRLRILVSLRSGPRTVSEIVDAVGMEQSAVSHQLRVLRDNSLVSMRRVGRTRLYALRNDHTAALIDGALAHVRELERPGS
jgi:DNA-binding transcriptional ArsR family regulator